MERIVIKGEHVYFEMIWAYLKSLKRWKVGREEFSSNFIRFFEVTCGYRSGNPELHIYHEP